MATGWRVVSVLALGTFYKLGFNFLNGQTYGPLLSAYLRKYSHHTKEDQFEITDRKREYFQIDTSQYMNYTHQDLGHDYHAHHGPQPEGQTLNQSWLVEMDKYLKGEDNKLQEHPYWLNYDYKYKPTEYPTEEDIKAVFNAPINKH